MNALLLISVVPLGVLGAVLIAQGAIGWGISLWLVAVVLSQATFVADVWAEYRSQKASGLSILSALVTCTRRTA